MKTAAGDRRPVARVRLHPQHRRSLRRERLERPLADLWDHRLGLVIALAGSGKTTLLNQFAETVDGPVVWYRAEADDASVERVLHGIGMSFAVGLGHAPEAFSSVEHLVEAVEGWTDAPTVLIIDDFHTLRGSPAETAIGRIIAYAPPGLKILVASRSYPSFDISRLRVSGELLEIDADDLRFRSWEVERLFRDFYGEPLRPEELAMLARRTGGWAAGLQLFHLATRDKPRSDRRRALAALSTRSRIAHDYLARNVLDGLAGDLRTFVLRTSVLGRLTGALCDELLDRAGSEEMLAHLEQREIFTSVLAEGGYRYHEALRWHLQAALVEETSPAEVRRLYHRAAALLHDAGALSSALSAYCRAEEWDLAGLLLGQEGAQVAADRGSWLDTLPAMLLDHDPWLLLATARRYTALGCLQKALDAYRRAEESFGPWAAGDACRRERRALAAWVDPGAPAGNDWLGLIRSALQFDPTAVARQARALPGAPGRLVEGVATLLAGRPGEARRVLLAASEQAGTSPVLAIVCRLVAVVTAAVDGIVEPGEIELLAEEAELLDVPLLARLCRSALALESPAGLAEAAVIRSTCLREGDRWSAGIVALLQAVGALWSGGATGDAFEESAEGFRDLGAGVAEAWARSGAALALAVEGHADAPAAARRAEERARAAGARGVEVRVVAALASHAGEHGATLLGVARNLAAEQRWSWPTGVEPPPGNEDAPATAAHTDPSPPTASSPMVLSCFGGFRLEIDGREIDGAVVKPRCRSALHILALHAGRPVHRESLIEALWPSSDTSTGIRNLHVAVSTLRHLLAPGAQRGGPSPIVRAGDAYQLAVPPDAVVDILSFEAALANARRARPGDDGPGPREALERCLEVYAGDLLPEDGPSEWVVKHRARYRMDATDAAHALAAIRLADEDLDGAIAACEWGLHIDPYRDGLWRSLIAAHDAAGQVAAAEQARRSYQEVIRDLGLVPPDLRSRSPREEGTNTRR